MAGELKTLHVHIDVHIDGGGEWEYDHHVDVPPDYTQQDLVPFIEWQLERAVVDAEEVHFGHSRAAEIIRQYDVRVRVIRHLLRSAPHRIRRHPVLLKLLQVLDLSNDDLFAQYGVFDLED